ncbi:hypothetical protein CFP56_018683, partial [Quercus suber]
FEAIDTPSFFFDPSYVLYWVLSFQGIKKDKLFLLPSHQHLAQRSSIRFLDIYQVLFVFFLRLGLFSF